MYGETVSIPIEYYEKGKEIVDGVDITLISQHAFDQFDIIREVADKLTALSKKTQERIAHYTKKLSELGEDDEEGTRVLIASQEKDIDEIKQEQKNLNLEKEFKRRVDLIIYLLEKNGCTESKFMNADFWYNDVHPATIMNFLYSAIYKDYDSKKKVQVEE